MRKIVAQCPRCQADIEGLVRVCPSCGFDRLARPGRQPAQCRSGYRHSSSAEVVSAAIMAPVLATIIALLFTLFAAWLPVLGWVLAGGAWLFVPISPFYAVRRMRRAIAGPCPYCGAACKPRHKPFNCKSCRARVLVAADGLNRA